MKTSTNKIYGVPSEAKSANYFIRVITQQADGTLICDGYKPSVKPKNPVNKFKLIKENGEWRMQEFMVCGGMQAAITPVNALNYMNADEKNALLNELAEDGAVKF